MLVLCSGRLARCVSRSKVILTGCTVTSLATSDAEGLVLEDPLATSGCCAGVGVIGAGEKCESTPA